MKTKAPKLLAGGIMLALLMAASGLGQAAQASIANSTAPASAGSIQVPKSKKAALPALAKIEAGDALAVVKKALPAAAVKAVELENENGCLIYSVELRDGGEVLVDAGNGKVLKKESPSAEHVKHESDAEAD